MPKKFDKLDEVFNVTGEIVSQELEPKPFKNVPLEKTIDTKSILSDIKKDYEYARGNMYSIIEKGQEAIDSIMELAQQSDSPRAYEVAGQLIKNVGDVTDKLIDLQHKMKKLKEEDNRGPSTVNNSVFIGSTADLQKLLKQGLMDSK